MAGAGVGQAPRPAGRSAIPVSRLARTRRGPDLGLRPAVASSLAALLLMVGSAATAVTPEASPRVAAERLVHLLRYVAVDYGRAVRRSAIRNPSEYAEMRRFSQLLLDRFDEMESGRASDEIRSNLVRLRDAIHALRPWVEVRGLAEGLATELVREFDLAVEPGKTPDLDRGRELYEQRCAACHGETGRGEGPAARGLDPPPTSFTDSRMKLLSLQHLHGSIRFGIDGTAMPAYADELDPQAIWDVASFVSILGAQPAPRRSPPETPDDGPSPRGSGIQLALQLQDAFAGVAERVAPSVVGVTGLLRQAKGAPSFVGGGGWREGTAEERLYPGFERARSGSGFVVSHSGHILTAYHLLTSDGGRAVDAVDVELEDGRHRLARIVGSEPTIGLGVLQLEDLADSTAREPKPLEIGNADALRVGHWMIALGNPAGPGQAFAVGTLASLPERQCYQEELGATLLQASLSVPPGAYGGPLVTIEGEVVGMLVPAPTGIDREPAAAVRPFESALPVGLALAIYEPLVINESRKSPWLGFSVLERRLPRRRAGKSGEVKLPAMGVYIDDVFEPSPAAAADVRVGDWLLAIDGDRLTSVTGFQRRLYLSGIGRSIALEILRDAAILEKRVTVEERPEAARPRR